MLELRPNCEICDCDLPPDSDKARICTYECTYCDDCAENILHNVCQNCGGNLQPRPIRPVGEWRPGTGLTNHPAGTQRRKSKWTEAEQQDLTNRLRGIPPAQR